ncbi:glycerophosphodiester phosphodiesterase family protein [Echinicola shivajiensis]|uniref:glycerophosphodiester phosphodiesterase family protein n=1 Tax=Echinicola shivajiensis TaxID=1035916 RepID=UPI001BFCA5F0|nr:glycerophosphodiester phosphodiesterase family protein [Echinicola shivajiensis]
MRRPQLILFVTLVFGLHPLLARQETHGPQPQNPKVEGHRGAAGLMPQNTLEAMIEAVKLGVNTLEFDLQISKDRKVILAHDAHINPKYTLSTQGGEIPEEEAKRLIFCKMNYAEIKEYDIGSKYHDRFPDKKRFKASIPLASDVIDSVENFIQHNSLEPICYNIEIKSSKLKEENGLVYPYEEYADKVMEILLSKNLNDRLVIQSADPRCLNYLHKKYPNVRLSYLAVYKKDFETYMSKLNFVPEVYSPLYTMVDEALLKKCKSAGMKLITWTVDEEADIVKMIELGVDGIISNYPNRVLEQLANK